MEEQAGNNEERSRGSSNGYAVKVILGFLVSLVFLFMGAGMKAIIDDISELRKQGLENTKEIARLQAQLDETKSDLNESAKIISDKLDRLLERLGGSR